MDDIKIEELIKICDTIKDIQKDVNELKPIPIVDSWAMLVLYNGVFISYVPDSTKRKAIIGSIIPKQDVDIKIQIENTKKLFGDYPDFPIDEIINKLSEIVLNEI